MFTLLILLFLNEYNCFLIKPVNNSDIYDLSGVRRVNFGPIPSYLDWREKDAVSPVKNQQRCAACWAFTAVANIESHLKIYTHQEIILSEQFLIDCDDTKKNPCQTGDILNTFSNIVSVFGGVLRDANYYPYAEKRMSCRWNPSRQPVIPVVGFRRVNPTEEDMIAALFYYGPLSAGINSASMARYEGNYIDEPRKEDCDPNRLNHAILIVGYSAYVSKSGEEVPYWIIKNSWGEEWGDGGYYYLVRGRNACGIETDVSFAFVH